jgi:hypothetical protein
MPLMNGEIPFATGLPLDDPDFMNHPDADIFQALGVDLRGYELGCDRADVEECDFQSRECERICPHE